MTTIKHIGHQVVDMMDRLGISPLTRNYHLFYTYIANSNPLMRRAVRGLGRFPTQDDLDHLIEEFCPEAVDSLMMRRHEAGLLKAIGELTVRLQSEQSEMQNFNSAIERVSNALSRSAEQKKLTAELLMKVVGAIGDAGKRRVAAGDRVIRRMDSERSEVDALRNELLQVRKMANTDALTGLANRRAFDEQLATLIGKFSNLTLVLIDIDHFKHINDTYGHVFGDHILKGVAIAIRRVLTDDAFLARTGGEEFAVILAKVNEQEAMVTAERIRKSIADIAQRNGEQEVKLTISLGVASVASNPTTAQLYEAADLALYRSKNAGRNRVTLYEPDHDNESSNRYQIYAR